MQSPRIPLVLCCAALLGGTHVFSADDPLGRALLAPEAQAQPHLCWAATSAMVVNSFLKPSSSARITQAQLATWSMAFKDVGTGPLGITAAEAEDFRSHWTDSRRDDLRDAYNTLSESDTAWKELAAQCRTDLNSCDEAGVPMLKSLEFQTTQDGEALSWCDVKNQIDNKRPILFGYTDIGTTGMSGTHFLVLLGHRVVQTTSVHEVQIWDPWPALSDQPFDVDVHLRWIPYADFVKPGTDWGVEARHQKDRYSISKKRTSWSAAVPKLTEFCELTQQTIQPIALVNMDMEGVHRLFAGNTILRTLEGEAKPAAGQTWGTPFPIIGLTQEAIVASGGRADSLIGRQVSTVLVPVLEGEKVVDVFVASNDRNSQRWRKRGYANAAITRMLVEARADFARRTHTSEESFYLVSVPSRRSFFVAQGSGAGAKLMPIATDAKLGVTRGEVVDAARVLGCIANEAGHLDPGAPPRPCVAP